MRPPRTWFPANVCALDDATRNHARLDARHEGAVMAALACRARTRPVSVARSAADDAPRPAARDEPTADTPLDAVFPDGSVQPLLV